MQVQRRESLISLEEAQGLVLEAAAPLDTEVVPLNKANGTQQARVHQSDCEEGDKATLMAMLTLGRV